MPATSANLGPGFDCLGLALDIFNQVELAFGTESRVSVSGEGERELPRDASNLVYRAAAELCRRAGREMPPLELRCHNAIPLARGLGSSAAAVVGGLVAANALLGEPFSTGELLPIAVSLEGHPDNVCPALFGGLQVVVQEGVRFLHASVPLPAGLACLLFVPDQPLPTAQARAVLPQQVSLGDAVYNLGRAALLVAALAGGKLELLRAATRDRLHQPYRQRLFPAMADLMEAALGAGALGAFLSGAGSTVLALAREGEDLDGIGGAMLRAAQRTGVSGKIVTARPWLNGAQVEKG